MSNHNPNDPKKPIPNPNEKSDVVKHAPGSGDKSEIAAPPHKQEASKTAKPTENPEN